MNDGMRLPCDACPWRVANHGKRHKHGFYTKRNLQRLWNQIRRGGGVQSCHPTDPGHPDHGAKPDSKAQECGGSVILVTRELRRLAMLSGDPNHIDGKYIPAYLALSRVNKGLTTTGLMYYLLSRRMDPPLGEGLLPVVTEAQFHSDEIGRPNEPKVPPR